MDVITTKFNKSSILHEYSQNEYLLKLFVGELLKMEIINWKHNRPPDEIRCNDIKNHLIKSNTFINVPLHFNYNQKYDEFECIDGIHRYTALTLVDNKELVNDKIVIIYIYINKTEGELVDIYQNINKSIGIPELYKSDEYSLGDKEIITYVINSWMNQYKEHFSSSANPKVPHINREVFSNFLTDIYNEHKIRNKNRLLDLLNNINQNVKDYIQSGISKPRRPITFSQNQLDKCQKTGCYLFLYKPDVLKQYFTPESGHVFKTIV